MSDVERVTERVNVDPEDDTKGQLLALLTGGKAYVLLTVEEASPERVVISLDHNSPYEGDAEPIKWILEQALKTLKA